MTSDNVTEVDTVEPSEAMLSKSVDDRLIDELVGRALAEGLQLTKRLLKSALEGEITDHLSYDKHDPGGKELSRSPRNPGSTSGRSRLSRTSPPAVAVWRSAVPRPAPRDADRHPSPRPSSWSSRHDPPHRSHPRLVDDTEQYLAPAAELGLAGVHAKDPKETIAQLEALLGVPLV
ncbi:hypothetical protein OH809_03105 [Streptomyces sp. NBC_00873]|uniref:hypothetical protein n=1 Tax=unclassified Streptomyces TaxID=2593676 RepID=UPI00386E83C8|nr:hypothetical protein OH809_03105 [Streptomyces sp. NBC_00873]WTA48124.1 hypothetical protein OH821_40700 [Streptomyces sp. NBC_00842]